MHKKLKTVLSLCSITLLIGCSLEVNPEGAALMTAINYEGEQRIVYSLDEDYYTPEYTDPREGYDEPHPAKKISKGDYKPVFAAMQNRRGVTMLEHQAAANSGDKKSVGYFRDNWMTKTYADMSMGTVYDINNYSVAGNTETILDLKPYIEETEFDDDGNITKEGSLPNIAKFLHDNPGVMLSIVTAKHSHPDKGAIYYVPYFDGFNDLEKATIIRADYTQRLLDDPADETFSGNNKIIGRKEDGAKYGLHFEPCYFKEETGTKYAIPYEVTVPNVDDEGVPIDPSKPTISFTKQKTENIIAQQNKLISEGKATSYNLAKQFTDYIHDRYPENIFERNSDLFLSYKACYDTDELVALMRLAKVSSRTLFGKNEKGEWIDKEMITMMPRTCDNMRSSDIYRWAGQVFGVRGFESRNGYLYLNGVKDYRDYGYKVYGAIHDARGSTETLNVLKNLKNLYDEGLILQDFDSVTATGTSKGSFADETLFSGGNDHYAGFMLYDYPKDLNDWNKYRTSERKKDDPCNWVTKGHHGNDYPYNLRAIVGAIAHWQVDPTATGEAGYKWMPFTESWASIKTSALCLNANLPKNPEKLKAAFNIIDYVYGDEGLFLYNFGPWEQGYITKLAGEAKLYSDEASAIYDYMEYQGKRYPKLTPKALEQAQELNGFNRRYVGSTIPFGFRKLNAMPYQTMDEKTRKGVDIINKAIELGTFKHTLVGPDKNRPEEKELYKIPFYQITPSAFFLTKGQSSAISSLLNKNTLGSMFTDSSSSNFNIWDSLIMGKETRLGVTLDNYLNVINNDWKLPKLELYYQDAYEIMSKPIEVGK